MNKLKTENFTVTETCVVDFGKEPVEVVVTDPCYLIDNHDPENDVWRELCAIWHGAGMEFPNRVEFKGCTFLVNRTKFGDGQYYASSQKDGDTFCVDAGLFCVVLRSELEDAGIEVPDRCAAVLTASGVVIMNEDDGSCEGAITVVTDGSDYEDEDYEDDYEEEDII